MASTPQAPRVDAAVRLRDGRTLAYAEWGEAAGRPMVLFHGGGSSRLMCPDAAATLAAGVRLITIDRPGYGGSDPKPGRRLLDWVDDYEQLCGLLALPPSPIVGTSNGGPYAMACAARLPDRVTMVGLAATLAPLDEEPRLWDELSAEARDLIERLREDPVGIVGEVSRRYAWYASDPVRRPDWLPPNHPDDVAMQRPGVFAAFEQGHREGARQGVVGFVADWIALNLPWGFSVAEIRCPARIWWGDADPIMTRLETEYLAKTIRRSVLRVYRGEGHAITLTHWADMLVAMR
jgi:pimeloyl-ACP methyl ester carboxylesterase